MAEAQPRSQLPTAVEVLGITDGGDQRAGGNWADAGHLSELAAEIAVSVPCVDLSLELIDLTPERLN